MSNIKVQEAGAKYCHFNRNPDAGYDANFFHGLLSEKMVLERTSRGQVWKWEKLPGHARNEALDCRNYALAGLRILNPDLDRLERQLKDTGEKKVQKKPAPKKERRQGIGYDEW